MEISRRAAAQPGRLRKLLGQLGPGLISGASDTDPTTVATMSVVGSTTGYGLSWLTILVYPMLASVQMISAQVGLVSRKGLQELVRQLYGRPLALLLLLSVLVVNAITIGADLSAGAAALGLLLHVDYRWFVVPLAGVLFGVLVAGSYDQVERVLKWVLLVLLAYVAAAFLAHPDWGALLHATLIPKISLSGEYVTAAMAVLGTTLTAYAYVWEETEEAERKLPVERLGLAQADAGVGMVVAVGLFWFILITTAATLGVHHKQVDTADQAAQALAPIAGPAASYLFGIGLLASSLIAVPVLAASAAYLAGQEFNFPFGLSKRLGEAREFYVGLGLMLLVAVVVGLTGLPPIKLLYWASIAGGLGTPISLALLLAVAHDRRAMGERRIGGRLLGFGLATLAIVSLVSAVYLWQQVAALIHR